jgi:hypothetical protein
MDQHKIVNFEKANPKDAFPAYQQVDSSRACEIRNSLARSLDSPGLEGLSLVRKLHARSAETQGLHANAAAFSVERRLRELGVMSLEKVYLNWYRFDRIDQMAFADLEHYFFDIWYPDSDDLDIFDDSLGWVLSIAHHGKVTIFRNWNPKES